MGKERLGESSDQEVGLTSIEGEEKEKDKWIEAFYIAVQF